MIKNLEREDMEMNNLLRKIYQDVLVYEEDTIAVNQEIETERSRLMKEYQERLNAEEMEELNDKMASIALIAEMVGFELGVQFAARLLNFRYDN